ncbi:19982_t:CDS:2 [Entrophospora sp. SA101]|nr:19982_t:CDS:2 [Entrophospora sp. SA101]CAJ0906635.1 7911_t:CDS:2 [Entrophospora sp. SA101]
MFNVALKDLAEPIRGKFKNNETGWREALHFAELLIFVPSQTSTLAIKGTSTALIEAGAVFQFVTSFQGTAQNIVNIEFCTVFSLTCMSIYN